jgi:hypothetical protein
MKKLTWMTAVAALALAGCGSSSSDKATTNQTDAEGSIDYSAAEAPAEEAASEAPVEVDEAASDGGEQAEPTAPKPEYSGLSDQELTARLDTVITCVYGAERLGMMRPEFGFSSYVMNAATLSKSVIERNSDIAKPLILEAKSRSNALAIWNDANARMKRQMGIMERKDSAAQAALFNEWAGMMSNECS